MNSRRNFIVQGSLATTALLAANPINALAKISQPFTELGNGTSDKFVLLHTSYKHSCTDISCIEHMETLRRKNSNALIISAGKEKSQTTGLSYDVTMDELSQEPLFRSNYKIIKRGNVRTGIVVAKKDNKDLVNEINLISSWLKNEKGCKIVICLSDLGFRNGNALDDIKLAAASKHLDIIIGGDTHNYTSHPYITLNNNKAEVIIHSADNHSNTFGKIEISLDLGGNKRGISMANLRAGRLSAA